MQRADIEVRTAGIADAGVLAEIGSSSFRDAYADHSDPLDLQMHIDENFTTAAVAKEFQTCSANYLLAIVDDQAGGLAKYQTAPCPVDGGSANAMELRQLYVLAEMQGHGLGRCLIDRLAEIAQQSNLDGIWLSAWKFADWATNFYEKTGFEVLGEVEFRLGATSFTDVIMWQSLR